MPRTSEHFAAAVAGLAAASRQHLEQLAAADENLVEPAAAAIARLRAVLATKDGSLPETWTAADRTAALAAAELMLAYQPGEAATAEKLLAAAWAGSLDASADADAEWKSAAQAQLVVALASQPDRHDEALGTLSKLGAESAEQLAAVIESLAAVRERSRPEARQPIAKLQHAAIAARAPQRAELAADVRQALDRAEAAALAAAGRRDQALQAYRTLAAANVQTAGTWGLLRSLLGRGIQWKDRLV
jgi:hypothetical protein